MRPFVIESEAPQSCSRDLLVIWYRRCRALARVLSSTARMDREPITPCWASVAVVRLLSVFAFIAFAPSSLLLLRLSLDDTVYASSCRGIAAEIHHRPIFNAYDGQQNTDEGI